MIYFRESDGRHLSIPDHRELGRGILRKLVRQAGLTPEEFAELHRK
jgi:predicted RNA binding protein YcfA (HicA-like mRNA interferase family)